MLKKVPDEIRRETLKEICEILDVAYAGRELVMNAIDNKEFKDFEDNLQDCCAVNVGADYIITANIKDFIGHSKVSPIAPDEFIKLIDQR